MYDSNPTLEGVNRQMDEKRQGEVFFQPERAGASGEQQQHFYIESYGCQMNFSDSEIVASILSEVGFTPTRNMEVADLILFLASDRAGWITGATVSIDGGRAQTSLR